MAISFGDSSAGATSAPRVVSTRPTKTPLANWTDAEVRAVLQPQAIVTYSTVRPPFAKGAAWGWTVQNAGPIEGQATLDETLDEFNRRDLTNYGHSIDKHPKDLR